MPNIFLGGGAPASAIDRGAISNFTSFATYQAQVFYKVKFHCVEFGMGPLAVPDVRLADGAAALHIDRGAINHFTSSATGGVK